ncbi:MAG: aminomethyltransferase family protein [Alphaproteobacteria bacterium]|nr:aminomethyltransferase family protein [Alphaproteobacteria bacterium]
MAEIAQTRTPLLPSIPALERTPFHPRLAELNLANAWEPWRGFVTASLFYDVEDEYFAVRTGASLYDVSPMLKYRIAGPEAEAVVDRLVTRRIDRLKPGRVAYAPWCDGRGRVVEEGTIFRLSETEFRINCAEPQLTWFEDAAWGFDATVADVSQEIAGLALQGPTSKQVLQDVGLDAAAALPFFGIGDFATADGVSVTVSRTGFTGDLGYEIWVAPDRALELWDALMRRSEARYLRPIGSRALERTRIEAGHILINVEFVSARRAIRESQTRTPAALGLDWAVDLSKDHFTGKRALLAEREAGGPRKRLVGLDVTGRKPAHGAYLYRKGKEVGQVTSACWSPIAKRNIALATVDASAAGEGTVLDAEIYYRKEITQGKTDAAATVVPPRFYQPAHRRG